MGKEVAMNPTPTPQVDELDEIFAEMYGVGVGMTAKKVLKGMHPDSFVAQCVAEAKATLHSYIDRTVAERVLAELEDLLQPTNAIIYTGNGELNGRYFLDKIKARINELQAAVKRGNS